MTDTKCYMIVFASFTDRDRFLGGYAKAVPPLVAKFGGRYVFQAPGGKLLESAWGDEASVSISEWPDRASAEKFWNSPEYADAKKLREGTGTFQVLLIDGPQING